jgi:hypothetical protein
VPCAAADDGVLYLVPVSVLQMRPTMKHVDKPEEEPAAGAGAGAGAGVGAGAESDDDDEDAEGGVSRITTQVVRMRKSRQAARPTFAASLQDDPFVALRVATGENATVLGGRFT